MMTNEYRAQLKCLACGFKGWTTRPTSYHGGNGPCPKCGNTTRYVVWNSFRVRESSGSCEAACQNSESGRCDCACGGKMHGKALTA